MSALLEVSGVSVTFDGFRAINNLSFSIGPAEMPEHHAGPCRQSRRRLPGPRRPVRVGEEQ